MIRIRYFLFFIVSLAASGIVRGQAASELRLHFAQGDLHRVVTKEVLRLMMHFPQVDPSDAKPSIRTTVYSFTERVDSLLPDGSAVIAASLDSFQTGINFGDGPHAENFFRFNSAEDWSITHELHDIKVLPRAQFLGHTILFVMRPDGTVSRFLNLDDFHANAIGHGYPYDMVHAMLSLTDSLRMSQLLELGMGGIPALRGPYTAPSTTTEIPVTRTVTATREPAGKIKVRTKYFDPPQRIEYLEGIATPMGISKYYGAGEGEFTISNGFLKHSFFRDTANVQLQVDIDTVPEEITRTVTTDVYPIAVMRATRITVREIQEHHGTFKDPHADQFDSDTTSAGEARKPDSAPH